MLSALAEREIKSFWEWVADHKDYASVEKYADSEYYMFLEFDEDTLKDFTRQFLWLLDDGGVACNICLDYICIDVNDIMGGFGFTLDDLWERRPEL